MLNLRRMLDSYHLLLASLDEPETQLLEEHLFELKRTIRPGAKRLNWTSLGIHDYLSKARSNISKLESMVNQIKKNSKDIQVFLSEFENTNFFKSKEPNADGTLLQCKEYFELIERNRRNDLTELAKKYKLIGPLITKVEGLVFGTNTSCSPKMSSYYLYWEKEIYNTITKMIVSNLTKFNENLTNSGSALFQIETILAVPDIALHLNANEMTKLFLQSVRDCIESANYFPRWMNGTCRECQPVKAEGQDEAYLYTFFADVVSRPEMRDLASQIHNNVQKTVQNIKRNLFKFKKYKTLWKADKVAVCEKFALKNPNVIAYDEKILYYFKTIEEVQQLPKFKDIEFVRLSMRSVCESISQHSKEWMKHLGAQLNESTKKSLFELKHRLEVSFKNYF